MDGFYTKAYFKKGANINSQHFTNSNCILLISVGQRYHEDEKLDATIQLINSSQFCSCDIVVADTLQRHNLQHNDAYLKSVELGNEWIERNSILINQLTCQKRIIRWNQYLNNEHLHSFNKRINEAYASDKYYQSNINETIHCFLERIADKSHVNRDNIFQSCLSYILEECPIIMPLWASLGYDFIIYPQPLTSAMHATYKLFVENQYPNKCNWLALRFKQKFRKQVV